MENFKDKFDSIICEKLAVERNQLTPDAKFTDSLGADSLDMVELVMEFEKEFSISIPDEVADNIRTVADAEIYILNIINIKES
ncbi:MAG: acyl carrier protein [Bacteroidota bacterium]